MTKLRREASVATTRKQVAETERIPRRQYDRFLQTMPLLCVDGVLRNDAGKILLVRRINEPLSGVWWVPGGRVLKGETLTAAFRRKMLEETGSPVKDIRCLGYFEAPWMFHGDLADGDHIHSLSIVFQASLARKTISLDSQSSEYAYFDRLPSTFKVKPFA